MNVTCEPWPSDQKHQYIIWRFTMWEDEWINLHLPKTFLKILLIDYICLYNLQINRCIVQISSKCSSSWFWFFSPPVSMLQWWLTLPNSISMSAGMIQDIGWILPGRKVLKFCGWDGQFPFLCHSHWLQTSVSSSMFSLTSPCLQVLPNTTTYISRFCCSCTWIAKPCPNLILKCINNNPCDYSRIERKRVKKKGNKMSHSSIWGFRN